MSRQKSPYPGAYREADRHGKIRWRYRRKGVSAQLPGQYASPEWIEAYEAAASGGPASTNQFAKFSIAWLVTQYLASADYQNMAESTRKVARRRFDWIRAEVGGYDMRQFKAPHINAVTKKKGGPAAANQCKKDFSRLFNFAAGEGWLDHNPARHAKRAKESGDGYYTWTDADIEKFLDHHGPGTKARLAMSLMLCTGMAIGDLRDATWRNIRGERFVYNRNKTDGETDIRLYGELAAELALTAKSTLFLIAKNSGEQFSSTKSLANWFKKQVQAAKLPDQASAHGLRKAGARRAAEAGANEFQVMAILGHQSTKEAITYVKAASRKRFADAAVDAVIAEKFSEPS